MRQGFFDQPIAEAGEEARLQCLRKADMVLFDGMPSVLREAVHNFAICITAESIQSILTLVRDVAAGRGASEHMALEAVGMWCREFEQQEMLAFAAKYSADMGREMPHLAARVSIMRSYGRPIKGRRGRRLPSLPP